MRIGWVSAAAHAHSAYGIITREICSRITDEGSHQVWNIGGGQEAIWGGKIPMETKEGKTFPILPTMGQLGGRDVVPHYVRRHNLDLIISLWDHFAINYADQINVPMINYLPVDGGFTRKMYDDVKHAHRLIAYSKFGYNELLKWFPPPKVSYIPHGIDTTRWRRADDKAIRETRSKMYPEPIPDDAYLIINVGANVGERKSLPQFMLMLKRLFTKYPDMYCYFHTQMKIQYPQGYELDDFARELGIADRIRWPSFNPVLEQALDEEMVNLYSASDLLASASFGEGFGMPLLEAMSCGTPCVVPRNSAQIELIEGHGWLVDNVPEDVWVDIPVWIPSQIQYPVVNLKCLEAAIEEAYLNRELVSEYGMKSRRFALNYDWDTMVMPKWFKYLEEIEEELNLFKILR